MSVGLAFSGGGVSAAIGAACAWNAIVDSYPAIRESNNLTISTVSGGSIGYGLWINANDKIAFPTYRKDATLEELAERRATLGTIQRSYYGRMNDDTERGHTERWCDVDDAGQISPGDIADQLRRLPFASFARLLLWRERTLHWWTSLIEGIFDFVCSDDIAGGDIPWVSSFAVLDEAAPPKMDPFQGTLMPSSATLLHHVVSDLSPGPSQLPPGHTGSVLEALSYTSAFWAAPLVRATIPYHLFNKALLRVNSPASCSSTSTGKVILDGGVVDTTGLVGLLQRRTQRIVAFYNNNVPLSDLRAPLSYLFGADARTDSMNSLLGPTLSQVFPSEQYPAVLANLTDPRVGVAGLRGVRVLSNPVLGVEPYVAASLVIFSNAANSNFALEDKRILRQLSPGGWPDRYLFSPPRLDANVLCMFNDWKVRYHREYLDASIGL